MLSSLVSKFPEANVSVCFGARDAANWKGGSARADLTSFKYAQAISNRGAYYDVIVGPFEQGDNISASATPVPIKNLVMPVKSVTHFPNAYVREGRVIPSELLGDPAWRLIVDRLSMGYVVRYGRLRFINAHKADAEAWFGPMPDVGDFRRLFSAVPEYIHHRDADLSHLGTDLTDQELSFLENYWDVTASREQGGAFLYPIPHPTEAKIAWSVTKRIHPLTYQEFMCHLSPADFEVYRYFVQWSCKFRLMPWLANNLCPQVIQFQDGQFFPVNAKAMLEPLLSWGGCLLTGDKFVIAATPADNMPPCDLPGERKITYVQELSQMDEHVVAVHDGSVIAFGSDWTFNDKRVGKGRHLIPWDIVVPSNFPADQLDEVLACSPLGPLQIINKGYKAMKPILLDPSLPGWFLKIPARLRSVKTARVRSRLLSYCPCAEIDPPRHRRAQVADDVFVALPPVLAVADHAYAVLYGDVDPAVGGQIGHVVRGSLEKGCACAFERIMADPISNFVLRISTPGMAFEVSTSTNMYETRLSIVTSLLRESRIVPLPSTTEAGFSVRDALDRTWWLELEPGNTVSLPAVTQKAILRMLTGYKASTKLSRRADPYFAAIEEMSRIERGFNNCSVKYASIDGFLQSFGFKGLRIFLDGELPGGGYVYFKRCRFPAPTLLTAFSKATGPAKLVLRDTNNVAIGNPDWVVDDMLGDILARTSPTFLNDFKEVASKPENAYDLYMSDAATGEGGDAPDLTTQERLHLPLLYAGIASARLVLRVGGVAVIKMYTFLTNETRVAINNASRHYDRVFIIKPHASRARNNEHYVVFIGKLDKPKPHQGLSFTEAYKLWHTTLVDAHRGIQQLAVTDVDIWRQADHPSRFCASLW